MNNKENQHPNLPTKGDQLYGSKKSHFPRVSRFHGTENDWRKKIMNPSAKEKEIETKLASMLKSQGPNKECLRTNLSQQRLISSFCGEQNGTLNKYCSQNLSTSPEKSSLKLRNDLMDILKLSRTIAMSDVCSEKMSQEALIQTIKNTLKLMLPQ